MTDRVLKLKEGTVNAGRFVVYRMSRDQRVWDNHALLAAARYARYRNLSLAVVFCLVKSYPGATLRSIDFMLSGLAEVSVSLSKWGIPFYLFEGEPDVVLPPFLKQISCEALFSDFDPLRIKQYWTTQLSEQIECSHYEADAHNIVPCRIASSKEEFGAYTIRPKINRLLPYYIEDLLSPEDQENLLSSVGSGSAIQLFDKNKLMQSMILDTSVGILPLPSGEMAAHIAMTEFVSHRLNGYDIERNFPEKDHQSNLSAYLHFGQLSAQRLALEVRQSDAGAEDKEAFLEQLIVRRELSDNYCFYNPCYDSLSGVANWAKITLSEHARDERVYLYSAEVFENGKTHDRLWNAAQTQLLLEGRIHGYMRMYWAKKILEWSETAEEALRIAIYLNDKYALDGRDPNGYVGCQWAIGGLHDRAWAERAVYGKIRYMNENGCRRKFDVEAYICQVNV